MALRSESIDCAEILQQNCLWRLASMMLPLIVFTQKGQLYSSPDMPWKQRAGVSRLELSAAYRPCPCRAQCRGKVGSSRNCLGCNRMRACRIYRQNVWRAQHPPRTCKHLIFRNRIQALPHGPIVFGRRVWKETSERCRGES